MDLHQIKKELGKDWSLFTSSFQQAMFSEVKLINEVNEYILQRSGKQLRPILVLLSARICGDVNTQTHAAAISVEMLHTASLLHDDVVDNADQRRGKASVKAAWKVPVAVLTGDYWLSKAAQLIVDCNEHKMLALFTRCLMNLSEGELFQLQKTASLDNTEEDYLKIIEKKTAILLATSTCLGAITAKASKEKEQCLYDIGYNMGMAFQIRDDIFDYEQRNQTGKPAGNDICEQKITLPLLYALQQAEKEEREKVIAWIKSAAKKQRRIPPIIKFVNEKGGIAYATEKMANYSQQAIELLHTLPDSPERKILIDLAGYMASRKK